MNLHKFTLDDLAPYTAERAIPPDANPNFLLMFAGLDDIHRALRHVLSRVTVSLHLNMFGYDDPELNGIIVDLVHNPRVTCLITLDSSQAGGKHEKALLQPDAAKDPAGFNTSFVIGQSETHRISHTKGFVADGLIGAEGSTNWSDDGEGTFKVLPGARGYHAQNNTQTFFTDRWSVRRFQARLTHEHVTAVRHAL